MKLCCGISSLSQYLDHGILIESVFVVFVSAIKRVYCDIDFVAFHAIMIAREVLDTRNYGICHHHFWTFSTTELND